MSEANMHILVSNHEAEISTFRRALGDQAAHLNVVDNNLGVLSLLSTSFFQIRSLVITDHQDEGINVETGVFVRNLLERAPNQWTTIVVGPWFSGLHGLPVSVVDTVEAAAEMVRNLPEPEPVAVAPETESANAASNGAPTDRPAFLNEPRPRPQKYTRQNAWLEDDEEESTSAPARTYDLPATPPTQAAPSNGQTVVEEPVEPTQPQPPTPVFQVNTPPPGPADAAPTVAAEPLPPEPAAPSGYPAPAPWEAAPAAPNVAWEPPAAPASAPPPAHTYNWEASPAAPTSVAPAASVATPPVEAPSPEQVAPPSYDRQLAPAQPPMSLPAAQAQVSPVVEEIAPEAMQQPTQQQSVEQQAGRWEMEPLPATTRSLADDIRDWTERNEQQRNQQYAPQQPSSLIQSLLDLLPANRKARADEAELDKAIRAPRLSKCHSIAVISPKGGVGKSFLTYLIGNFLAEVRGDKIVAIDTNPDFGTLADQVRSREEQTVSTLLERIHEISHYSDLRRFTSKVETRLEVLAAPADPDVMATITADDYDVVYAQLRHYYDTVLFDCGTGFRDDITRFALQNADQVVLVSAPLFITTGIVIRALGYLDQVGVPLGKVTLAINQVRSEKPLDLDYMHQRFGDRLNAIVEIPFDMQLYHDMDRGEFSVERTQISTRLKIKELLANLVKHFE